MTLIYATFNSIQLNYFLIDAVIGGTLNKKATEEAQEFIEEIVVNNYQWHVMRTKSMKVADVFNIDGIAMLARQMEALNKKFDGFNFSKQVNSVMHYNENGAEMINPKYSPFNPNMEHEKVTFWVIILDLKISPITILIM